MQTKAKDRCGPEAAALVVEHWKWADRIGRRLARKHFSLDEDDFAGAAMLGLIDAAIRYVPGRGADFKAFAYPRVAGAVGDFHRTEDTLTRHERESVNRGQETKWMIRRGYVTPRRYGVDISDGEKDLKSYSWLARALCAHPDQEVKAAHSELCRDVRAAVRRLPSPYRDILVRAHFDGENLARIGVDLGVTESRVCQLAKEGLTMLPASLRVHLAD